MGRGNYLKTTFRAAWGHWSAFVMCEIDRGVHVAVSAETIRILVLLEFGPGGFDSIFRLMQPAHVADDAVFSWCRCRTEYEQPRRAFPASHCSPDDSSS